MRSKAFVLTVAVGGLTSLSACESQEMDHQATFEVVWRTVNETFPDTTFGGIDWTAAHDRYQARLAAADTDEAFYRIVNRMLWELDVSHANLVPPGLLAVREPLVCAEGSPGLDLRVLDGAAVITSVASGSPAEGAGLRPGSVILAVDGVSVEEILEDAGTMARPPRTKSNRISLVTKELLGRLFGDPGTEVAVRFRTGEGEDRETNLMRTRRPGRFVGPGGLLYLAVELEATRLRDGVGYVRLNTFQPPLVPQVSAAIRSLGEVRGLILDVRGNAGGEIEGMFELFLEHRTLLYHRRSRVGDKAVFVDPAPGAFSGPLVVLVDPLTGSAGELFAAGLQAVGRAVVAGERSPGSVMESDMMPLPNGAIFMYPVARVAIPDGTVLEGRGVVPDLEVRLEPGKLLRGIDSQLEAAVEYLTVGG